MAMDKVEWSEKFGHFQMQGEEPNGYSARIPLLGGVDIAKDPAKGTWTVWIKILAVPIAKGKATSEEAKQALADYIKAEATKLLALAE